MLFVCLLLEISELLKIFMLFCTVGKNNISFNLLCVLTFFFTTSDYLLKNRNVFNLLHVVISSLNFSVSFNGKSDPEFVNVY